MLLTKAQKHILCLVNEYGGLKQTMLRQLSGGVKGFDKQIKELKAGGRLFSIDGYLCGESGTPCSRETETALEVMLEVGNSETELFQKGAPPFNLTFFKQRRGKLCRYDVCVVREGAEILVAARLEGIRTEHRIICLVIDNLSRAELLNIPCEHCFVIKEKGKYRFYK